jgi:hypothetical protein
VSELQALLLKLLLTAKVLGGYPIPETIPSVHFVSPGELAAIACSGNCQARGLYEPQRGILLSDHLDPVADVRARGVLLHEVIHYLQDRHRRYADRPPCERYYLREREAYTIENRYLARHQEQPNHGLTTLLQNGILLVCPVSSG